MTNPTPISTASSSDDLVRDYLLRATKVLEKFESAINEADENGKSISRYISTGDFEDARFLMKQIRKNPPEQFLIHPTTKEVVAAPKSCPSCGANIEFSGSDWWLFYCKGHLAREPYDDKGRWYTIGPCTKTSNASNS